MNEEIDRMRHSATSALLERRDVIVVASVSCIYGIGAPESYRNATVSLRTGQVIDRDVLMEKLIAINFKRNDIEFARGTFRVRGRYWQVFPMGGLSRAIRIEFFRGRDRPHSGSGCGDRQPVLSSSYVMIFPATHYAVDREKMLGQYPSHPGRYASSSGNV